ncbi:POTRA domain-containing protein [Acidicapsa ligni]|uniref:POTRA domain-containing protein n=1 Tax=Acidicapsa ligni TaxID=542300 RepID=UPI0021DF9988|nr:POTRA domain-containing protein [Acidicapsa ligni]
MSANLALANRGQLRVRCGRFVGLLLGVLLIAGGASAGLCQQSPASQSPGSGGPRNVAKVTPEQPAAYAAKSSESLPDAPAPDAVSMEDRLQSWEGKQVLKIEFGGVSTVRLEPLPKQLAQQPGTALSADKVRLSLRRLFATGLYETISVDGRLEGDGVTLIFSGQPRTFIGVVSVEGARGANTNSLLVRASRLTPGTRFKLTSLTQAEENMRRTLTQNGFHEPVFSHTLIPHPEEQLVDIAYKVDSGPQARNGNVASTGESGLTPESFLKYSGLKPGKKVNQDTPTRALSGLLKHYRKDQRLEAEVKLQSQQYLPASKTIDYDFTANRGPVVHVIVDGVNLSQARIRKLVPVYEEGAVDEDLLNEGNRRLQNYYQRLGYFDVKVTHEQKPFNADHLEIVFHVQRGVSHRVEKVSISGAKYFDVSTLLDLLSVRTHDAFDRHGIYNQSLVSTDVGALQAIYQNNGFSKVKVTPEILDDDKIGNAANVKRVGLRVNYQIAEGLQQRVHSVQLDGTQKVTAEPLVAMLNTVAGQPLSPQSLAGDRDTLITYYLSRGFDQAQIELSEAEDKADPSQVDVVFHIREGEQVFLRRLLITGLHYTRQATIDRGITLHEGDPLNQTALLDTQRNLYDLALFNEVNPVIENPTGEEPHKTVLLQTTEARRWDISYGAGFELQTGTVNGSTTSNPNGATGASPRVLLEVSRINIRGKDQTASLRGTYGLLEQRINLLYQYPHLRGSRNFGFSFSGGYNNSQDVTTYSASKLEGSIRLTEHFYGEHQWISKANTFVYQFIFRRVKVDANSIQVEPDEISLDSEAVQVGGPSFNWIRDTRDTPLDSHRGTYTSFQEFIASSTFGSQANFNQVDISNSSYYKIDRGRIVLARNTRYGQERAYGRPGDELIPLPERLYGGGGNSHRGFGINSAGPRDPQTGFPIGGAGVFINSTELRLPPPTLPYVGNSVSFVLFHDMGNVFTNASDIWASSIRFRQQDREGCRNLSQTIIGPTTSTGQQGTCTFNYFSHAPGIGLRYNTPVGPVRVDFSYNLNPPIYPVTYDALSKSYLTNPYVGEGSHFNFFFSLGQSF